MSGATRPKPGKRRNTWQDGAKRGAAVRPNGILVRTPPQARDAGYQGIASAAAHAAVTRARI